MNLPKFRTVPFYGSEEHKVAVIGDDKYLATVSRRYALVDPEEVARVALEHSFLPTSTQWTRSKGAVYQRFSYMRGALPEASPMIQVSQGMTGKRALFVHTGVYRLVCTNGLVRAKDAALVGRLAHIGNALGEFRRVFESAVQQVQSSHNEFVDRLERAKRVIAPPPLKLLVGPHASYKIERLAEAYQFGRQAGELSLWDLIQAITEFSQSRPPRRRAELDALAGQLLFANT